MSNLKTGLIIIFIFVAASYAGEKTVIEGRSITAKEVKKGDKDLYINFERDIKIISSNGNIFSIRCGSLDNKAFPASCNLIVDRNTGGIKSFLSGRGSIINGYNIPDGVFVKMKHNSVAWIVKKEIKVESFSFEKLSDDKTVLFVGKGHRSGGYKFKGPVYVDSLKIRGFVANAPVSQFDCQWDNIKAGPDNGMTFDPAWNLVSAKLYSGSIYGFRDKLNYYFSYYTKHDGVGVLKMIKDDKDRMFYGDTGKQKKSIVFRPISWNGIVLDNEDVLEIKKEKNALPQDMDGVGYTLYLKDTRKIKPFGGKREYSIRGFPYEINFYGNLSPESFVIGEDADFIVGRSTLSVAENSSVEFFKDGSLMSVNFSGIISIPLAGREINFTDNIIFHENSLFKEGVVAEDIGLKLWGRDVTVEKGSVLRFSKHGEFETITTTDEQDSINIIYTPDFD